MIEQSASVHSTHEVWQVVTEQGRQISVVQNDLGNIRQEIGAVKSTLDAIMPALNRIAEVQTRVVEPKTTQWLSIALTCLGTLGLVGWLALNPVDIRSREVQDRMIRELEAAAYHRGHTDAQIEGLRRDLDAVDYHGSRRWIGGEKGQSRGD